MRALRLGLAGTLGLWIIGMGLPCMGQDGTVTEDVLFELVVPASAVPERPLGNLYFEAQTVDPGADSTVGSAAENMTGRAIFVDSGVLLIEPLTDAFLWRQEAARARSEPEDAPAAEPVSLSKGDLLMLPTISREELAELGPDAALRVANPGTEMAVTYGFHLCSGGGRPAWPEGMSHISPTGTLNVKGFGFAPLANEETLIRLTRTRIEPGATIGLDEDVLFRLYRLESGTIDASYTSKSSGKALEETWEPGFILPIERGTDWVLRASSDAPASMLSLIGTETASSME